MPLMRCMMLRITRSQDKYNARIVDDDGDGLPFAHAHAVEDLGVAGDFGVRGDGAVEHGEDIEDARDAAQSGEHAVLLGENGGRARWLGSMQA